jgi:hypothetical protein
MAVVLNSTGAGDTYCFDLVSTPANAVVNRALGSGNSGSAKPTAAGTAAMATLPCDSGPDAAVVGAIDGTSSFFAFFHRVVSRREGRESGPFYLCAAADGVRWQTVRVSVTSILTELEVRQV